MTVSNHLSSPVASVSASAFYPREPVSWISEADLRDSIRRCVPFRPPEEVDSSDEEELAVQAEQARLDQRFSPTEIDDLLRALPLVDLSEAEIGQFLDPEYTKLCRPLLVGLDPTGEPTVYFLLNDAAKGDPLLGEGATATIAFAIDLRSGRPFALKAYDMSPFLQDEIDLMKQVRGKPGIVQMHFQYEIPGKTYLIIDHCDGGDLFQKLHGEKVDPESLSESQRLRLAIDIAEGLYHIHQTQHSHRDLKPENILLVWDAAEHCWRAKIGDLATAKRTIYNKAEVTGSLIYMSPEKCAALVERRGGKIDHEKNDLWAFGLILYQLFHMNHRPLLYPNKQLPNKNSPENAAIRFEWMNMIASIPDKSQFPEIRNGTIRSILSSIFTRGTRSRLNINNILTNLSQAYTNRRNLNYLPQFPQALHSKEPL